jgi:hypothetical protein
MPSLVLKLRATKIANFRQLQLGPLGDLHVAARRTQNGTQRENWQFAIKRDVAIMD